MPEPEQSSRIVWLIEHVRSLGPEFAGGFAAYVLHELYHKWWKKLARLLVRGMWRR